MKTTLHAALAGALSIACSASLFAQVGPLTPFERTLDLLIVDSTFDGVWRKVDANQDGDFNDLNEVLVYYDDVSGSIALTNPSCIAVGTCGTAYVGDSTVDIIMALDDLDANGDALGAGEHRVYFDNLNASGIQIASIQGLTVDAMGAVFVAASNTSSLGDDAIYRLFDANGDGDANDLGEATEYCLVPNSTAGVGDSIPTEVRIGHDGFVYYADVGATGVVARGIYQLRDLNLDGDCNDAGENNLYWSPPATSNAFYWGLEISSAGLMYVTDHGNEQVWVGIDSDGSGQISGVGEEFLYYQTANSTWWDVMLHHDGTVYLCEDQAPDRIVALRDLNLDLDALDPGEATEAYNDTISAVDTRPRAGAFLRGPSLRVTPSSVGLGQSVAFDVLTSRPGDLVAILLSPQLTTPISVAPLGYLEVSPAFLLVTFSGPSGVDCGYQATLTVPNDPALSGRTYAFQAIAGNLFRLVFTEGRGLTIL